jgi:hypothetical protein
MSLLNSTGERLRRATALWHAYLAGTGQRFELAQFLRDPAVEKQILDGALASGDAKLIGLVQEWLRDTGRSPSPQIPAQTPPPANPVVESQPTKSRYLRGVR